MDITIEYLDINKHDDSLVSVPLNYLANKMTLKFDQQRQVNKKICIIAHEDN